MLQMKVKNVVAGIARQEVQQSGRENQALYFNFDVRLSCYTDDESYDESCGLHLLYHSKPGFTYVDVFSAVTENCFAGIREVEDWKHESSHDSCWRDIQVFSQVYFGMAERINQQLKEDGLSRVAPCNMSQNIWFQDSAFRWIPVEIEKDRDDDRNYRKLVKVKLEE